MQSFNLFRKSLIESYAIGTTNPLLSRWILKWRFIRAGVDPKTVDTMTIQEFKLYDALREADEKLKKRGNKNG